MVTCIPGTLLEQKLANTSGISVTRIDDLKVFEGERQDIASTHKSTHTALLSLCASAKISNKLSGSVVVEYTILLGAGTSVPRAVRLIRQAVESGTFTLQYTNKTTGTTQEMVAAPQSFKYRELDVTTNGQNNNNNNNTNNNNGGGEL